jgi:hypothetical protein
MPFRTRTAPRPSWSLQPMQRGAYRRVARHAVILAAITVAACAHGRPPEAAQPTDLALPPAVSPELVMSALRAQVTGPGGCSELEKTETVPIRFFSTVTFVHGWCTGENGAVLHAIAGADTLGVLYVLDSRSAFTLLRLRHPPGPIDQYHAVEYASRALALSGYTDWGSATASLNQSLPDAAVDSLAEEAGVARSRVLDWRPGSATVRVTTSGADHVTSFIVDLDTRSGAIHLVSDRERDR